MLGLKDFRSFLEAVERKDWESVTKERSLLERLDEEWAAYFSNITVLAKRHGSRSGS